MALTPHSATQMLTVLIQRPAGAQVVDMLRVALCTRLLKAGARQLRQDWQASDGLGVRKSASDRDGPLTGEAPPY